MCPIDAYDIQEDSDKAIETVRNLVQQLSNMDARILTDWTTRKYEKYPFFD